MLECKLTVYFEDPFWVGVFERRDGATLRTARVVFGAEPKDYDVYGFIISGSNTLRYGPPIKDSISEKHMGAKRAKRAAKFAAEEKGIGTKAQQALKAQREQAVTERIARGKQQREEEQIRNYELRRQKQKEKHRGR